MSDITLTDIRDMAAQHAPLVARALGGWIDQAGPGVGEAPAVALRDMVAEYSDICDECGKGVPPWMGAIYHPVVLHPACFDEAQGRLKREYGP